jgi:hypothetical protein
MTDITARVSKYSVEVLRKVNSYPQRNTVCILRVGVIININIDPEREYVPTF